MKIYQKIASCLSAMENCRKNGNEEWMRRHYDTIVSITRNHLPSGSGWDCGTKLEFELSTPEKLVFSGSFHHMNDAGYYDGWSSHTITVRPSLLSEFDLTIGGRDRNGIKEYLHEVFHNALRYELVEVTA